MAHDGDTGTPIPRGAGKSDRASPGAGPADASRVDSGPRIEVSRRAALGWVGLGAATVAVAGVSGMTARAVGQGVLTPGQGDAYAAWSECGGVRRATGC